MCYNLYAIIPMPSTIPMFVKLCRVCTKAPMHSPKSVLGPAKSLPNFCSLIVSLSGGSKKSTGLPDLSLPIDTETPVHRSYF